MKQIKLTKGKFAMVDDSDFDWLNQWKWSFNNIGYAVRFKYLGKINDKPKCQPIYMHRFINQTPKGLETDHINRNKLDNRRENLRTATKSQNGRNKNLDKRNTSGVRGITFYKRTNQWRVRLSVNKEELSFGYYSNFDEAKKVLFDVQKVYFYE